MNNDNVNNLKDVRKNLFAIKGELVTNVEAMMQELKRIDNEILENSKKLKEAYDATTETKSK